jgi:hypothetical protein
MRRQLQALCFVPCLCSADTGGTFSCKLNLNAARSGVFPQIPYCARGRIVLRLYCAISDDSIQHHPMTEQTGEAYPTQQSTSSTALPDTYTTITDVADTVALPSTSQRDAAHVPVQDAVSEIKRVARSEATVELVSFLRSISLSLLIAFMMCFIDIIIGLVVFSAGSVYAVSELFAISIGARTALRACRGFAFAVWGLVHHTWFAGKRKIDKLMKD